LVIGLVIIGAGVYVWAGANQKTETDQVAVTPQPDTSLNAPVPETEKPVAVQEKPVKTSYPLSQLSAQFVQYKDRHVSVSGQYGGWSHACPVSKGKTRSDWVLFDGSSCLFVSGAMPKGLNHLKPNSEAVEVVGVLRATDDGKYYLEGTQALVK
jgi:hypothetical protein